MTNLINLETVEAYLASTTLPTGATLPAPLVVLPDETPLYEEDFFLRELEESTAEDRPAKIDLLIEELETYSSTLITVTFSSEHLENKYRVNIPRQLLQVGRMYNTILKSPAIAILTVSEVEHYATEKEDLEKITSIFSDDIIYRLFFPAELTPEQNTNFNQILNHMNVDFFEGVEPDEITPTLASKVAIKFDSKEFNRVRAEIVDIIISLINGREDGLVELYEYAENLDAAHKAVEEKRPLTDEERLALVGYECVNKIFNETSPNELITSFVEEDEIETINDFEEVIFKSGKDLERAFQDILVEYHNEHPEALKIDEESSIQERIDYLSHPTNTVPLLGGLLTLSDRINVDLLYSRDWNNPQVSEEDYFTRGEYLIILCLVIAQRIQMFAKTIGDDTVEDLNRLAMSMLVDGLTNPNESNAWILEEGLKRMATTESQLFNGVMSLVTEDEELETMVHGPFGNVMHWFGHSMIDEKWSYEAMMLALGKQESMKFFVEAMYDNYNQAVESTEQPDADDHDFDEDETPTCYVMKALVSTVESDFDTATIIKELGEALKIFAELNVMRNTEAARNSDEWKSALADYFTGIVEG